MSPRATPSAWRCPNRCCGSTSGAAVWVPGCCSTKAARPRRHCHLPRRSCSGVQSARRQPAHHIRQVRRRQPQPPDRPVQRLAGQQRLRAGRASARAATPSSSSGVPRRCPCWSSRTATCGWNPADDLAGATCPYAEETLRGRLGPGFKIAADRSGGRTRPCATPPSRTTAGTPAGAAAARCWAARTSRRLPFAGRRVSSGRIRASSRT